jgi:hypothetical protein
MCDENQKKVPQSLVAPTALRPFLSATHGATLRRYVGTATRTMTPVVAPTDGSIFSRDLVMNQKLWVDLRAVKHDVLAVHLLARSGVRVGHKRIVPGESVRRHETNTKINQKTNRPKHHCMNAMSRQCLDS